MGSRQEIIGRPVWVPVSTVFEDLMGSRFINEVGKSSFKESNYPIFFDDALNAAYDYMQNFSDNTILKVVAAATGCKISGGSFGCWIWGDSLKEIANQFKSNNVKVRILQEPQNNDPKLPRACEITPFEERPYPYILFPKDFALIIKDNPALALSVYTQNFSYIRDYGRTDQYPQFIHERALACQAEILLKAEKEGTKLNNRESAILDKFESGTSSLPYEIWGMQQYGQKYIPSKKNYRI